MDGVAGIAISGRERRLNPRRMLRKFGFWVSVAVLVSPAILVFLWMLSLSLKTELDNSTYPPVFIPIPPTLANYVQVFTENSMAPPNGNCSATSRCLLSRRFSWSPR